MDDLDAILNDPTIDMSVHVNMPKKIFGKKKITGSASGAGPVVNATQSHFSKEKHSFDKLPNSASKDGLKRGHEEVAKGSTAPPAHKKPKTTDNKDEKREEITFEDFQACANVAKFGEAAFKKLEKTIVERSSARLRGKISEFKDLNKFLDGELIRTSWELKIHRDRNLVKMFEENRSLKAKLEKLSGVQKRLGEAHEKAKQQANKIEKMPELEADLKKAKDELERVKEESMAEMLKKNEEREQLKKEQVDLRQQDCFRSRGWFSVLLGHGGLTRPQGLS